MSVSSEEIANTLAILGLHFQESFCDGTMIWKLELNHYGGLSLELATASSLLQAISSELIDTSRMSGDARLLLYSNVLRRNALLQIGHYELVDGMLRYRATIPVDDCDLTHELLQRWVRSAIAETTLFRMNLMHCSTQDA